MCSLAIGSTSTIGIPVAINFAALFLSNYDVFTYEYHSCISCTLRWVMHGALIMVMRLLLHDRHCSSKFSSEQHASPARSSLSGQPRSQDVSGKNIAGMLVDSY